MSPVTTSLFTAAAGYLLTYLLTVLLLLLLLTIVMTMISTHTHTHTHTASQSASRGTGQNKQLCGHSSRTSAKKCVVPSCPLLSAFGIISPPGHPRNVRSSVVFSQCSCLTNYTRIKPAATINTHLAAVIEAYLRRPVLWNAIQICNYTAVTGHAAQPLVK